MKLRNVFLGNHFNLDIQKIELHSVSKRDVELPYIGDLPKNMNATAARIYFNIQPTNKSRVCLIVSHPNSTETRYPLDATAQEIEDILSKLFDNPFINKHNLSPYWLGFWQANFFAWRELQSANKVFSLIDSMSGSERDELTNLMKRTTA